MNTITLFAAMSLSAILGVLFIEPNADTAFAALSVSGLLPLLLDIIILAVVCWLLWWLIGYIGIPEPFNKVLRVIVAVVAVIWLINVLLSLSGNSFITR